MSKEKALHKCHTYKVVLEEFECPVCTNYMIPPIKSCVSGHNFCYDCDKKILICPLCRGNKDPARNLGMENIFNKLIIPCVNNHGGCTMKILGADLKMHQRYCPYRILLCPLRMLNNCPRKGLLKDLVQHCVAEHESNIFFSNTMNLIWPRFRYTTILKRNKPGDYYCILCQAYGELFKCIWDLDMQTGFTRWCVVYMGPISNIDKYSFEICFENVENPVCGEPPIRLLSSCHPDDQVLFQSGKYIITHTDMMRKLCGLRGLYYTVKILKDGVIPQVKKDEEKEVMNYFIRPEPSVFFNVTVGGVRIINLHSDEEVQFEETL